LLGVLSGNLCGAADPNLLHSLSLGPGSSATAFCNPGQARDSRCADRRALSSLTRRSVSIARACASRARRTASATLACVSTDSLMPGTHPL
jgi:hypothetical protein